MHTLRLPAAYGSRASKMLAPGIHARPGVFQLQATNRQARESGFPRTAHAQCFELLNRCPAAVSTPRPRARCKAASNDAGDGQLDSELEAEFKELFKSTQDASLRNVLRRNKTKLVKSEATTAEALRLLTLDDLVTFGLSKPAAALLKNGFPSPSATGVTVAQPVPLQQFMAEAIFQPALYRRQLTRSATKSAHAVTPERVACWENFDEQSMSWFGTINSQVFLPPFSPPTLPVWNEAGVWSHLDLGVFESVDKVLKSGVLGVALEIACPAGLKGEPDRAICEAGTMGSVTLAPIEVKHGRVILDNEQLHMYEKPPSDSSERTTLQRVVEQTNGYMVKNGLTHAVMCDDHRFWFSKIEGECLYISRAIKCSQTGPTATIGVCFIAHLALQQRLNTASQPGTPKRTSRRSLLQLAAGASTAALNLLTRRRSETYSATSVALGRTLGRGSVGAVYEGTLHGTPVAVKVAHQKMLPADDDEYSAAEAEQHLHHEIASYSRLAPVQGRVVPRLIAHGTLMSDAGEPFPFLATSRVGDGLPLCEAAAQLQPSQLAAVARAAVAAVEAIHQLGVVHGDVRSPNVLLDADGSVKLVDFSEAVLQPQAQEFEGDMAGMRGVLTTMAQECLNVNRGQAAAVVQQWLGDVHAS